MNIVNDSFVFIASGFVLWC